ncbi:hypothetical protein J437_LFUL015613 [Ladona fulva]|uniref:Uncharacterized protein n=1 Tax=Ladona fulva TaxID=123851 RepID=A0A8K0P4M5_LADFU|nr:hypothetical protein J437_LFUL015613 [Ladona fulva]
MIRRTECGRATLRIWILGASYSQLKGRFYRSKCLYKTMDCAGAKKSCVGDVVEERILRVKDEVNACVRIKTRSRGSRGLRALYRPKQLIKELRIYVVWSREHGVKEGDGSPDSCFQ